VGERQEEGRRLGGRRREREEKREGVGVEKEKEDSGMGITASTWRSYAFSFYFDMFYLF
jgi:hypothetical protein